jgi:hypothetical protein
VSGSGAAVQPSETAAALVLASDERDRIAGEVQGFIDALPAGEARESANSQLRQLLSAINTLIDQAHATAPEPTRYQIFKVMEAIEPFERMRDLLRPVGDDEPDTEFGYGAVDQGAWSVVGVPVDMGEGASLVDLRAPVGLGLWRPCWVGCRWRRGSGWMRWLPG